VRFFSTAILRSPPHAAGCAAAFGRLHGIGACRSGWSKRSPAREPSTTRPTIGHGPRSFVFPAARLARARPKAPAHPTALPHSRRRIPRSFRFPVIHRITCRWYEPSGEQSQGRSSTNSTRYRRVRERQSPVIPHGLPTDRFVVKISCLKRRAFGRAI